MKTAGIVHLSFVRFYPNYLHGLQRESRRVSFRARKKNFIRIQSLTCPITICEEYLQRREKSLVGATVRQIPPHVAVGILSRRRLFTFTQMPARKNNISWNLP